MYDTSEIRKGLKVEMDGQPWTVTYFQFVKPGKGTAFTRTKLKSLLTGNVVDRTFRTGEKLEPAQVETVSMQYMYNDADGWNFMNTETFDQISISADALGTSANYLIEDMVIDVLLYKGKPVNVELPNFVEMVIECDPGVKGNTAQGGTKPATLPNGATIQVPLFIETGTKIRIDTRTDEYMERVKE